MTRYILNLSCIDRAGIVAAVSAFLFEAGMNIDASDQFGDHDTERFFMRVEFSPTQAARPTQTADEGDSADEREIDDLRARFAFIAQGFGMDWHIYDQAVRVRALILVSRFDHCLVDLIYQTERGSLRIDIRGVVSNHDTARDWVERAALSFHRMSEGAKSGRDAASMRDEWLAALIEREAIELIILARYMQILSPELAAQYGGRIINIHHSFLPSFKGAVPYSRAYERGVKMIGATAHFVTAELDEGPIIAQGVAQTRHDMSVDDLINVGRDVERSVLANAVKLFSERRLLLNGSKTIVFD